ncbi:MAG: ABC transporter ATP-binding protein [Bacteroidetes bacterium]|nr:ABC transporter ATP-binding protein [Bacteroidota bacterium]MBV6461541.1 Lipoprotein-releasing system ATP-binding protein LolD [Flavobacteriales bacterium]WKZ76465.1 MAG: ABC transporter ATP-binding protein [Vicingaceae bacterium]MCL4815709.1 ABC transporter ATP-binding protein [Flavobacteriales bacterium]NOG94149.1 ABC transporter ATP-binding protein [Bacteroidota bacterium]
MIKAINIHKKYGSLEVLKGVDISIAEAEVISIVGASGAGKTTFLQILGTLDKPDSGELIIKETAIKNLKEKELASFRNKNIGFVFQFHHLLPEFTAIENICIPAFIANTSKREAELKAEELLAYMGLLHRKHHKPNELSGGEQQRVAVARALINNPAVIFADEPTGNLDSHSANEMHTLFFMLREKFKQTFVIVTHNTDLANMADRKLEMKDGIFIK